jgi:4'-phosphopantetheinyl transferase
MQDPDIAAPSPVGSDRVHVFASFMDAVDTDDARYRDLLERHELERASRFVFERDRRRHLLTRALARTTLARFTGIAPEDIRFAENAYGRPEIANEAGRALDIRFNLSHTAGLVVLALTSGRDVGIDVEAVSRRDASLDIADRFFSPSEAAALRTQPASDRDRRFFDYWTLKEAYIKARGMGLSLSLDKFSFRFTGRSEIDLEIDPDLGDSADRWWFWQFDVEPDCLIALCVERIGASLPQLSFSTVVPLVSQQELSPSLRRGPAERETAND